MSIYWRAIAMLDQSRPPGAMALADGWCWFDQVERIERAGKCERVPVSEIPANVVENLTARRAPIAGLSMDRARVMGIVNTTPDSFSDGGKFSASEDAIRAGTQMVADGADILDIGGESTRPGAAEVDVEEEISRTEPVVHGLANLAPVSIDTRKSAVATAALNAGALIVNDVSALNFDPALGGVTARANAPICLMHAKGAPENMQDDPSYEDVLLDVYDGLSAAIDRAIAAGIARHSIIVDPGIGFGKTMTHNLTLLRRLSLFHTLGCPILLGASRKRFIGTITGQPDAGQRLAGSLAIAGHAYTHGVQITRVHDTKQTREHFDMARALHEQN